MQAYGSSYRNNILFTINFGDIQDYINVMETRTSPINFTYIDAIGVEAAFGTTDPTAGSGLSNDALHKLIINEELSYEATLNTAFQISRQNGTNLVIFSGGLKVPGHMGNLQSTLMNMNLNDPWVPELYLHWIARLKTMGVTTLMFS
jgi:hypothetical protein